MVRHLVALRPSRRHDDRRPVSSIEKALEAASQEVRFITLVRLIFEVPLVLLPNDGILRLLVCRAVLL